MAVTSVRHGWDYADEDEEPRGIQRPLATVKIVSFFARLLLAVIWTIVRETFTSGFQARK